jgi:hypothetical protein
MATRVEVLWTAPSGAPARRREWYVPSVSSAADCVSDVKVWAHTRLVELRRRPLVVVAAGKVWSNQTTLRSIDAALGAASTLVLYVVVLNPRVVRATLERVGAPRSAISLLIGIELAAAAHRAVLSTLPAMSARSARVRGSQLRHRKMLDTLSRAITVGGRRQHAWGRR